MFKNIFTTQIFLLITVVLLSLGSATNAFAAGLGVTFQADPLFSDLNITPGDSVVRTVTVSNGGPDSEAVYLDTRNNYSNGLADVMTLDVASSTVNYYSDTFTALFTTSQVHLGTLAAGESRTYSFTAAMASSSGNTYQTSTMGFDLCVGFSGGTVVCDSSGTSTTPGGTGGGGGGGGGSSTFRLFNEAVDTVSLLDDSATISWDTNRDATSYLVCGNTANGPFNLNPTAPYFGYEFDTPEITSVTKDHIVTVVVAGAGTYECRPASREEITDDFTVGGALTFVIPEGAVEGITTTNFPPIQYDGVGGGIDNGRVLGESTSSAATDLEEDNSSLNDNIRDKVDAGKDNVIDILFNEADGCIFVWLLLIVLISFLWSLFADRLNSPDDRFYSFFNHQLVFTAVYTAALLFVYWLGALSSVWWLFALSWVVMTSLDYRAHSARRFGWNPQNRNIFYTLTSVVLTITALWFSFPCVWWPFAVIAIGSLVLLAIQSLRRMT